jgi:preprotein translocase subunit YajC
MPNWILLAQGPFGILLAQGGEAEAPQGSPWQMLPALAMIAVLFYFLMVRPERRKQAAHRELLEALKKNDRVVTVGGIYGVVMNVDRAADKVTLKIDETTNAKIQVTYGSISRVVGDEPAGDTAT